MAKIETNTRRIMSRLLGEGWINDGGSRHAKLSHPGRPGIRIMVPRHAELTEGVARSIARAAGWI